MRSSSISCGWEPLGLVARSRLSGNEVVGLNWEGRNANKTNENRSVRTGQGELANRRQGFALPKFNQRMRKQLGGTAKRELSLARDLLICISEDQ